MPPVAPPPIVLDTLVYHRVSTESQADDDRTSVPEQRRATSERAAALGRQLHASGIFEDLGVSGATAEGRPGFMALLTYCNEHPRPQRDGMILVLNDSRFGRFDDAKEATHWQFVLSKLGWIVRFCEGDEMEEGNIRDVFRLLSSGQASEYRKNLKRTAARATRATAEQGRWQNRAPTGYRRLATRKDGAQRVLEFGQRKAEDEITRLTLGPDVEQEAIRFAFQSYAAGAHSIGRLVKLLRERFPARRWNVGSVNATLKNPVYAGDIVWCRRPADKGERRRSPVRSADQWVVVRDAHPAIVSRELFAEVQAKLAANKKETRATEGGYPLSGFVRCLECSNTFVGGGGKRGPADDPDRFRFYRDGAGYKNPNPCPGPVTTLSKRWLEPLVIGEVAKVVSDPRVQRVIAEELDRALDVAAGGASVREQELEKERSALVERRQRVVDAISNRVLTDREAAATLTELRARVESIEAELERLKFAGRRLDTVGALRERMLALAANFAEQAARVKGPALRELLRPWVRDATINKQSRILTLVINRVPDIFGSPWAGERGSGEKRRAVRGGASMLLCSPSVARRSTETRHGLRPAHRGWTAGWHGCAARRVHGGPRVARRVGARW